jgi:hypothetical protein
MFAAESANCLAASQDIWVDKYIDGYYFFTQILFKVG